MSIAIEITRLQTAKANIKSAIEQKGVTVGDGTIDTYAEKISEISSGDNGDYNQGYEDGKNSVSNPLEYARGMYEAYLNVVFPEGYELTLNVPNITTLYSTFNGAKGIKKIVIKGNATGNGISFTRAFRSCRSVETIDLTEFDAKISGDLTMAFYNSDNLVEILGELDFSEAQISSNSFALCSNLVTLTPKKETIKLSISFAACSKLSDVSIQSIIDGLADLTGSTAQTLTVHKTVYEKIIANGWDALITAKNWILVSA